MPTRTKLKREEAICRHREFIDRTELGTCGGCGQQRQYSQRRDGFKPPKVIRRGQIGGKLTMIQPTPLNNKGKAQDVHKKDKSLVKARKAAGRTAPGGKTVAVTELVSADI